MFDDLPVRLPHRPGLLCAATAAAAGARGLRRRSEPRGDPERHRRDDLRRRRLACARQEARPAPIASRACRTLAPDQYLADLNDAQREAVLTTEGPLLVIAGAGSGKTRVLTYRVAHLIAACGVKPNEILAITFTNKAAGEMRERLEGLLGGVARAIWILTFHAACGRILRREAPRLGYKTNFTIYDSADQVRLTKQCLEDLERDPKRFVPRGIHAQISNAKNQLIGPADYMSRVDSFYDQTVAEVYEAVPEADARVERDGLRRPADAHGRGARALPGGAHEVAQGVPLRDGRRVPGHEPRAVPAAAAARRRAPEPDGRRRPGSVDLRVPRRRHPQHPRLRARLPGHEGDPARAELPLDEHDPRGLEPRHPEQPRAQGEEPLVGARRGPPGPRDRGRGRARRGAVRRRRDRRARRGGLLGRRDRGLLPDERADAACSRTCSSARGSPTR